MTYLRIKSATVRVRPQWCGCVLSLVPLCGVPVGVGHACAAAPCTRGLSGESWCVPGSLPVGETARRIRSMLSLGGETTRSW